MSAKSRATKLIAILRQRYATATTALNHSNAFELLVATILSAQTTDKLVNTVTPALFAHYPTPQALAAAPLTEVERLLGRVNFFRNKSKNIVAMANVLCEQHGGEVPRSLEALIELPGVARKTANVVMGTAWGIASGIVVDTHVMRLAQLLGLTVEHDPKKIEGDLMAIVPQSDWVQFSHLLIHHGRETCVARRPRCDTCGLNELCPSATMSNASDASEALETASKQRPSTKRSPKPKPKREPKPNRPKLPPRSRAPAPRRARPR